jgi:phage terminase small subunit
MTPKQASMAKARAVYQAKMARVKARSAFAALNPRQRMFVLEYAATANGTRSAIKAGYSERSAPSIASTMLRNDNVQSALREKLLERQLNKEQVLDLIQQHAVGLNPLDYLDQNGKMDAAAFERLQAKGRLVKSYKVAEDGRVDMEAHSTQIPALTLLAKHHALLVERVEVAGPEGGPIQQAHTFNPTAGATPGLLAAVAPKQVVDVQSTVEPGKETDNGNK